MVVWTTAGFDIGSATTQAAFSRVTLMRRDSHFVVADRSLIYQSDILLTPYASPEKIDSKRLADFISNSFATASLTRDDVDTGAVILTGLALLAGNARRVAEAVADDSGKFIAISAGDLMEARLAARGAGAKALSTDLGGALIHIDMGGGTTKLSLWSSGRLLGLAAIDVGARLVTYDFRRRVTRIESPARAVIAGLNLRLEVGDVLSPDLETRLAVAMARDALRYAGILPEPPRGPPLLRTRPLPRPATPIAGVAVSGGVSEYVYSREHRVFGDLGPALGKALRAEIEKQGIVLLSCERGIRSTVLGVSQNTVQLSGNTIFVSDKARLPLRNVPMLAPHLHLDAAVLDRPAITRGIIDSLTQLVGDAKPAQIGLVLPWRGSATYARLNALAETVADALRPRATPGATVVLVIEQDVAGVLGERVHEAMGAGHPVVALDSIHVHELDHLDVGKLEGRANAVPVVIKSLFFAGAARPQQTHGHDQKSPAHSA